MKKILLPLIVMAAMACNNNRSEETAADIPVTAAPAPIGYSVIKMYPHDTSSYTQGLEWYKGMLYEGSGDPDYKGVSKLSKTEYTTGKDLQKINLSKTYFGEGITVFNNNIYQLTYEEHKVFVYDASTFKKLKEFEWPFEGWGLTHNDTALIVSTGESNLYFVDPETFRIKRTLGITDNNGYVGDINELEYVDGMVYANIYGKDIIVKINPATGKVEGRLDLSGILSKNGITDDPRMINGGYVLNGIAYNSDTKTFFVTGKRWPAMFEIRIQ